MKKIYCEICKKELEKEEISAGICYKCMCDYADFLYLCYKYIL